MQRNYWKWRSLLLIVAIVWNVGWLAALLALGATLVFAQAAPAPTPLMQFTQQTTPPAISSELIGQIFLWGAPIAASLVALYVTLRKASSTRADASAAVQTSAAQTEVDQRNVLTKLAASAVQANDDVRKSREAAEEAVAIASNLKAEMTELRLSTDGLRTENVTLTSTVNSQQSEINTLKKQVQDLTAAGLVSKDEVKERDAEIKRLNAELYRVATNNMPPGFAPQAAPAAAEEPVQEVKVVGQSKSIEVTETKDAEAKPE